MVALFEMAEGIEEHESRPVVAFGILFSHVGVLADDCGVVACLESLVCYVVDRVFYLFAVSAFKLKVGVCNETCVDIVRKAVYEFLSVCVSVITLSHA